MTNVNKCDDRDACFVRRRPQVDTRHQTPYIWGMEVQLTPDQQALVSDAVASGRLHRRLEILAAVELSKASLARGEGRTVATREESDQLVSDITRRGMARLAAEQTSRG